MARAAILCMAGTVALTACGDAPDAALQTVAPSREAVTVEGIGFEATLRSGPPGERLTAMGAVPTQGMGVIVRREYARNAVECLRVMHVAAESSRKCRLLCVDQAQFVHKQRL